MRVAETLVRVRRQTGKCIHLDIEPEPDGLLENSGEVVAFFRDWLLPRGASLLSERLGIGSDEARAHLLDHIQVCFDTCHVAVAYEEPAQVLEHFAAVGIRVGKVQISSALRVLLPSDARQRPALREALGPFVESTYLHQVVQRNHDGTFRQHPDLCEALPAIGDPEAAEWRIHFHVPIFVERYGRFCSTQDDILRAFALLRERRFTRHLEIETYTWGVLPAALKLDLTASIGREYEWVLDALA